MTTLDARALAARQFALDHLQLPDAEFAPASADASFRRYFRLTHQATTWVVMDAPPDREDCRPFIKIAELTRAAGIHGPQVLAQDLSNGYLLLSDLGRQTFLQVMTPETADNYFTDALKALIAWQKASQAGVLPEYDAALLERELSLFSDWYVAQHLKQSFTTQQRQWWQQTCAVLVGSALDQAKVYVHRDFMPRNLMVSDPNPGVLDFQDAVYGPITYDIASFCKDAFCSWPQATIERWRQQYWHAAQATGLPVATDYADFVRAFDLMALQRHLKVLGIFARINYRDHKPHYLADTPRFIRYVREILPLYPELAPLTALFDSLGLYAHDPEASI